MLRLLVMLPLLVILIIFALSNRADVTLSFIGYATVLPLSVAVLIAAGVFFLLGALVVWFGELRQRRRARRAEQRVVVLEGQLAAARRDAAAVSASARTIAMPALGADAVATPLA